jgi:cell division protein FtsI/penicillin-binding protein 2
VAGAGRRAQLGRLHLLSAVFAGVLVLLGYRLFIIQFVEHERYAELARDERFQKHELPARRGALLDANGHPLAVSVLYDAVEIAGAEVRDPQLVAASLAPLLEMRQEDILAGIDQSSKVLKPIKRRLPSAVAAQVEQLKLRGIYLRQLPERMYPEGNIAAQVLGFTGQESNGLAGVEFSLDDLLAGTPGLVQSERDTDGKELALGQRHVLKEPQQGADLVLTIDRFVQRLAERTLAEAVASNKAIGGQILVMDPKTGAIIAMAAWPTYNLTDEDRLKPGQETVYKTVQVTNQYEPGSVMKPITIAAGLQEQLVSPTTTVNDNGRMEIGGATIQNWDQLANGSITMTEVLIRSSNVGTLQVSTMLGPDRFYRYLDAFGFGKPTGVDLPGEVPGTVRTPIDQGWSRVDLATNSFGQGVAVTTLQMLTALSAIANDGVLMKPKIVREIRRDGRAEPVAPEPVSRVISPETARTLTEMLIKVLDQPLLQQYKLPGYTFAGKTGTADFPTALGYGSGKTYASIFAFGPLPEPRFAMLVRLDAPEEVYGGRVATPVMKRLAEELVTYYRIPAGTPVPAPTAR